MGAATTQPTVASSYVNPVASAGLKKKPTLLGTPAQNRPASQDPTDPTATPDLGGAAGNAAGTYDTTVPVQRMGAGFGRPKQKQLLGYAGTFLTGPRGVTGLGG